MLNQIKRLASLTRLFNAVTMQNIQVPKLVFCLQTRMVRQWAHYEPLTPSYSWSWFSFRGPDRALHAL
jgi:hypothetical protein